MNPFLEDKIVVVTGAGGFVGPFIVHALLRQGATIRALTGAPGQVTRQLPTEVVTASCDITDLTAIRRLVEGSHVVVHLAGPASVKESFVQADEYARVHISGTSTVLQACASGGVRQFVYMSSAEVYGRTKTDLVREDHPLEPRSPYGVAKVHAEMLVKAFAARPGTHAVILRPFSIYGPGVSSRSVLGTILRQARRSDCIKLYDLRPIRDYCYVEDVADAVAISCTADVNRSCVLNVGTGLGTSVHELAKVAMMLMGSNIPIREVTLKERSAESELYCLVADTTLARQTLGWSARTPLSMGIQRTIQQFA
jgi:nucleoside-diphosphate-sugar epimerase